MVGVDIKVIIVILKCHFTEHVHMVFDKCGLVPSLFIFYFDHSICEKLVIIKTG